MMFNKGDKVRFVKYDASNYRCWKLHGDTGLITTVYPDSLEYEVLFDGEGFERCKEKELALAEEDTLPMGSFQSLLGELPGPKEESCDCGTEKTHGDVPADAHSPWCKVYKRENYKETK